MEITELTISIAAVLISIISLIIAQLSDARAKKAEAITHLLGEKETVAFAALKLIRDGLPRDSKERSLVLAALLEACVFESSDRARALLYRVIELNRVKYRVEFSTAMKSIEETFASMESYGFQKEELDLEHGSRRLSSVKKVIEHP